MGIAARFAAAATAIAKIEEWEMREASSARDCVSFISSSAKRSFSQGVEA
jgi:hypothetical protein